MERAELVLAPVTVPFCLGMAYVMGSAGHYLPAAPFAVLGFLNTVLPPIVAKSIADDANLREKKWQEAQAAEAAKKAKIEAHRFCIPRLPEL